MLLRFSISLKCFCLFVAYFIVTKWWKVFCSLLTPYVPICWIRFAWKVQHKHWWHMIKKRNLKWKKWSLFDIVGTYSSEAKMTLKVWFTPMETTTDTDILVKSNHRYILYLHTIHLCENITLYKYFFLWNFVSSY